MHAHRTTDREIIDSVNRNREGRLIVSPYEQAFNRIRAEYMEMLGMRLTAEQVGRLSGVGVSVCRLVLDDLSPFQTRCRFP
jgi:hypothetical protein